MFQCLVVYGGRGSHVAGTHDVLSDLFYAMDYISMSTPSFIFFLLVRFIGEGAYDGVCGARNGLPARSSLGKISLESDLDNARYGTYQTCPNRASNYYLVMT